MKIFNIDNNPAPVLVLGGFMFLIPAYKAMLQEHAYLMWTYIFLCSTTILFHSTRLPFFLYIDVVAVLNHIIGGAFIVYHQSNRERIPMIFATTYSFLTYLFGSQYNLFSFDSDWNIKMFFHILMYIFSVYAACVSLDYSLKNTSV